MEVSKNGTPKSHPFQISIEFSILNHPFSGGFKHELLYFPYIYLIFTYIYILLYILYYMFGNNPSHWLIFFKRVIAPNQILVYPDFWKPWKMVGLGPPPVTTSSTRQGYRNWDSYETLEIMGLPSGKLTWLWKIWLIYLVKMVNFHSHVSLPEDIRG